MSCPNNANMSARVRNNAPRIYRRINQLAARVRAHLTPGHPVLDRLLGIQSKANVLVRRHGGAGLAELIAA